MRHASTLVQTAALAMMGTTLVMFPAAAQQMVANVPAPDLAACDQIKDPGKSAQCSHDKTLKYLKDQEAAAKARGAAAEIRSAGARKEGSCADDIKAEIAAGRIKPEALKAALAGRSAREVGACNLFNKLTRS